MERKIFSGTLFFDIFSTNSYYLIGKNILDYFNPGKQSRFPLEIPVIRSLPDEILDGLTLLKPGRNSQADS